VCLSDSARSCSRWPKTFRCSCRWRKRVRV
jgi:hypothetical protein